MKISPKATIAAALDKDSTLFPSISVFFGALAVCRGLRLPNYWAATQAQIDYRNGVLKRGLFGATLKEPLHLTRYTHFALVSFVLFAGMVALFILFTRRSGVLERSGNGLPVAVFASSLVPTFFAHMVGYLDIPQLMLILLLLLVESASLRFMLAIPLCVAGLLLHESFLLLYLPILLFSFFADGITQKTTSKQAAVYISLLACFSLCVCLWLSAKAPMTPAGANALEQSIQASVDFPVRSDFFTVLQRSAAQNVREELHLYRTGQEFAPVLSSLIVLGPVILFELWFVLEVCTRELTQPKIRAVRIGVFSVIGCTLAMQLLGWDIGRWYCIATLNVFLTLALLVRNLPQVRFSVSPAVVRLALLLIAVNMASGETLFDEQVPKPYPFLKPTQLTVRRWLHDHTAPRPNR